MADDHFDVDSLADYLHLLPAQVAKLADRGRLPGRRVGGSWRFARAEIHHWLEERIGASSEEELLKVEDVLDRSAENAGAPVALPLVEQIPEGGIAIPLDAKTRASVIHAMIELAAQTGMLWDPVRMEEAVSSREELHPTAMENGVALLHARRPLSSAIADSFLVLGITGKGIPFGDAKGNLTDVFFLICSADERSHLRTLARLSRLVANPNFLPQLRAAENAKTARETIREFESALT